MVSDVFVNSQKLQLNLDRMFYIVVGTIYDGFDKCA